MRAGTVVANRLCLEEKLGVGGFGAVWSATDLQSGARVAVKISAREMLRAAWRRGVFDRETAALRQLHHPAIVRWLDTFATEDVACLVMELAVGDTLARSIGRRAAAREHYSLEEVGLMMTVMCEAVSYAHAHGVLHRDLKTPNVVAGESGLKLLDFGIAKLRDGSDSEATTQGRALGTLSQIAPEQILGKPVDERIDVYGLGCIAFELLTLRAPWVNNAEGLAFRDLNGTLKIDPARDAEMIYFIARGERPSLLPHRSDVTEEIQNIVRSALAIDIAERPSDARAFGAALAHAIRRVPREIRKVAPPWMGAAVSHPSAYETDELESVTPPLGPSPLSVVLRDDPGLLVERTTIGPETVIVKTVDIGRGSPYEVGAALDAWLGVCVPGVARLLAHHRDRDVPDRWVLVFENIDGMRLDTLLARTSEEGGAYPHPLELFDKLAAPIDALHALGLTHGALHFGNAVLTTDGNIVWTDPGWVDALGLGDAPSRPAPALTPEIIERQAVTARTDVFQLAARLYELATMRHAFARDGRGRSVALHDPPPLGFADAIIRRDVGPEELGRKLAGPAIEGRITTVRDLRAHVRASAMPPVPSVRSVPPVPEESKTEEMELPPPPVSPKSGESWPKAVATVAVSLFAAQAAQPWIVLPLLGAAGLALVGRRWLDDKNRADQLRAALDAVPGTTWHEISRTPARTVLNGTRADVAHDAVEVTLALSSIDGRLRGELGMKLDQPSAPRVVSLRDLVATSFGPYAAALLHLERHGVSRVRFEGDRASIAFDVHGASPARAGADACLSVSCALDLLSGVH